MQIHVFIVVYRYTMYVRCWGEGVTNRFDSMVQK